MFLYDVLIQFSELFLSIVSLFLMSLILIAAAKLSQVTARFIDWLQSHERGQLLSKRPFSQTLASSTNND